MRLHHPAAGGPLYMARLDAAAKLRETVTSVSQSRQVAASGPQYLFR